MDSQSLKIMGVSFILSVAVTSCGGGSGSSSSDKDSTGSVAAVAQSTNRGPKLAGAFPVDLGLASPFAASRGAADTDYTGTYYDYGSLVDRNWSSVSATVQSTCRLDLAELQMPDPPSCLGPELQFQGHPDDGGSTGRFPKGALPIWTSVASNQEGCGAAAMNFQMARARAMLGTALESVKMTLCAGNVSRISLPDVAGDVRDLKEELSQEVASFMSGGSLTAANVARLEDDDGHQVYEVAVEIALDSGGTLNSTLTHTKVEADNSLYEGNLAFRLAAVDGGEDESFAGSVTYEKLGEEEFNYEFRQGSFPAGSDLSAQFTSGGRMKIPESGSTFSWGRVTLNPLTTDTTAALAWVDSLDDTNVHSAIGTLAAEGESGCIYMGFGDSLAALSSASSDGKWIDRMQCNPGGPGELSAGVASLQKQCVVKDGISGLYKATESQIRFVPRNSCGEESDINDDFTWRYGESSDGFVPFLGPNELVPISDIDPADLTIPESPSNF